jgi:primary-amine oxidase
MPVNHPLHPITASEIENAVKIFRGVEQSHDKAVFSSIELVEPSKDHIHSYQSGDPLNRVVRLLGTDPTPDGGFKVDIHLGKNSVDTFERLSGTAQAPYGAADFETAVILTKKDPRWLAAVKERGITDIDLVQVDPWPGSGYVHSEATKGHRMMRSIAFVREDKTDNGYARPIHGLIAHVDLTTRQVLEVEDTGTTIIPPDSGRFDKAHQGELRSDLKPLQISQPEGPSFTVDNYKISWQGWEFRISVHPVHGLVLHQLSNQSRPILYRASLSEMVVPYGDKSDMHSWKHVLDASEYSMGTLVNSLTLGCDCVGDIHYFDVNQITWDGKAKTIKQAICLHEEDFGIQWKHTDAVAETTEVRRSRRLVISTIHTVGNYDYGFYWNLYLDGNIQMEVKLTGIVGISAVTDDTHNPEQAPIIGRNLASPVHQHLFCFRLDWELDGGSNSLFESQIEVLPISADNPDGTQFRNVSTHLKSEQEAKRKLNPEYSRNWKITNPNKLNSWGQAVAYKLLAGASPTLLAHPDSIMAKRAAFAMYNIWATPFNAEEYSAGGPLTVMHEGQNGLGENTESDRDISQCDLVLWHTFGLTHVPRPEDWPVMPVEYCGFHLIPVGFFDRNPTLDLPSGCN